MKFVAAALFALLLGQVSIVPFVSPETCGLLEQSRQDESDACTPLCPTCSCCTTGQVFTAAVTVAAAPLPVAPPEQLHEAGDLPVGVLREVLHVPLA
jgi:hypothetical protein